MSNLINDIDITSFTNIIDFSDYSFSSQVFNNVATHLDAMGKVIKTSILISLFH